jgi:VWFA-related protein
MLNRCLKFVLVGSLALFVPLSPVLPQQPPPNGGAVKTAAEDVKPPDLADTQPDTLIDRATVNVVQVPVTVTDRYGSLVSGVQPNEFHLFDNGKEQNMRVDEAVQPISLVVAIQCTNRVDSVLTQIKKAGNIFGPQVIGEGGEAAVIAFDHRIREMQSFTSDADKITAAIKKINAGSSSARMIDAVDKAVYLLRSRPATRRRIILLVSEDRDQASEGRVKETLLDAQLSNVTLYSVNISRFVTALTAPREPARPDPLPASAYSSMIPRGPATPTSVEQMNQLNSRAEFVPAFKEIYKDVKGIFIANPTEVFTHETGGSELSFYRERGLQDAVQRISDDIHSQYILSYNPNNKNDGGYHEILIRVDRPDVKLRYRPGYYLASIGK